MGYQKAFCVTLNTATVSSVLPLHVYDKKNNCALLVRGPFSLWKCYTLAAPQTFSVFVPSFPGKGEEINHSLEFMPVAEIYMYFAHIFLGINELKLSSEEFGLSDNGSVDESLFSKTL